MLFFLQIFHFNFQNSAFHENSDSLEAAVPVKQRISESLISRFPHRSIYARKEARRGWPAGKDILHAHQELNLLHQHHRIAEIIPKVAMSWEQPSYRYAYSFSESVNIFASGSHIEASCSISRFADLHMDLISQADKS